MCKLRRKLLLFDHTIAKLVEWEKQNNPTLSTTECLSRFSGTRLMKCLYSLCLVTIPDREDIDETLFSVFDNFVAYVHGPVESDAYNNREFLLRYTYADGRMWENQDYKFEFEYNYLLSEEEFKATDDILLTLIMREGINDYRIMIDHAIEQLKRYPKFPFNSIEDLIKLSHLGLWKEACMTSARRLDVTNIGKLQNEFKNFVAMIQ